MEISISPNDKCLTETFKNHLSDSIVAYILYHNDESIRKRTGHLSYQKDQFLNDTYDPYPIDEYILYKDLSIKVKTKTKKFIAVNPNVKKWFALICARLIFETDQLFDKLSHKIDDNLLTNSNLDAIMYENNFEFNLFKLIGSIVGNHGKLIKKHMPISLADGFLKDRILDQYRINHGNPRQGDSDIAYWLSKLLDNFFKIIAIELSIKNWYDRDATVNEKNLPPILWKLAENTDFENDLYEFLGYIVQSDVVDFGENKMVPLELDASDIDPAVLEKMKLKLQNDDKKKGKKKSSAAPEFKISNMPVENGESNINTVV
jgi:hypothetical protein